MQAFCDPFQGFSNCVLFIFCSKVIVMRLLRPCIFPLSNCLRSSSKATRFQEERQSLISKEKETSESGSSVVPKTQTPQLIRVFYKPNKSSSSHSDFPSEGNRTSDYATDEDVPTNPSHHISYGSVDQRVSNGTQSLWVTLRDWFFDRIVVLSALEVCLDFECLYSHTYRVNYSPVNFSSVKSYRLTKLYYFWNLIQVQSNPWCVCVLSIVGIALL